MQQKIIKKILKRARDKYRNLSEEEEEEKKKGIWKKQILQYVWRKKTVEYQKNYREAKKSQYNNE